MGVNTKSFDNASDMITFSRASGGYGLTKVGYGSELVSNGDFSDGSTGWTLNPTAGTMEVVNGKLVATNATSIGAQAFTSLLSGYAIGTPYEISFTVSDYVSGNVQLSVGNTYSEAVSSNGTFNFVIPYTAGLPRVYFFITNTSLSIDNISVKEVTYNSSDPSATLKLIYHPNDVPRIEYNTDGTAKGLLIEEARTNLIKQSAAMSISPWSGQGNLNSTGFLAPDGSSAAIKLYEDTSTGPHQQFQANIPTTAGTYTGSVYAKAAEYNNFQMLFSGFGFSASLYVNFQLTGEGSVTASAGNDSAAIESVGDGWYRCSFTATTATTNNEYLQCLLTDGNSTAARNPSYLGDGASGIYLWGAQMEAGSFPTSYIETTGSTATRAVDVASIPVSKFGYNQTEGTLFVDFKTPDTAIANALELGNSASSSRYLIRNGLAYYSTTGGAQVVINYTASTNNQRAGFAVQSNDAVAVVNGSTVGTDNTVTLFSNPTILGIGSPAYNLAVEKLNGHIKSIQYYPRRLTDAQLQELTT